MVLTALYVPAAHGLHPDMVFTATEPAAQPKHVVALGPLYEPGKHATHPAALAVE